MNRDVRLNLFDRCMKLILVYRNTLQWQDGTCDTRGGTNSAREGLVGKREGMGQREKLECKWEDTRGVKRTLETV